MFEISGVTEAVANEAMRLAIHKLPMKCRVVKREEAQVATTTNEVLRQLTAEELTSQVRELKEELFNLRFQAATGQLESHGRLSEVRKEIARVYTIIRERELGIGGAAQ
ncbi:hypothetical protein FGO68_gene10934 [Halteria grandinella]|uniref:Large ribosomal subunit protein uL29 n=1 Tax=Halteria grandinella TaxID=5974 RepID=A0A8J8N8V7_HALGN|nr:hypothetical protein FGO68_gene10934 [Halteria grandinella]